MNLLLYGAVPLHFPEETSLAVRGRRKAGAVAELSLERWGGKVDQ